MLLFELKVGVDHGRSKQDSGTAADITHEVVEDAERTNADTTESCSGNDVPAEVLDHSLFAVAISDNYVLLHQLRDKIMRGRATDVDPDTGEDGTVSHNKEAVDNSGKGHAEDRTVL